MTQRSSRIVLALVFAGGAAAGWAASKVKAEPGMFVGKEPKAAATALLQTASTLAEDDSWQNIAIGRVYYLGGMKQEGQAIFDRVLGDKKAQEGDYVRVARVYLEAKEWERARPLFERALQMSPDDEDWQAELGMYHNLRGDRAAAEALFQESFRNDPSAVYNLADVAGSYLGVAPRR